MEKNISIDENGHKYILFKTDVYFDKFLLLPESDEKGHTDIDLIFEKKRKEALEKNVVGNLLELMQVMQKMVKKNDLDYEVGNVEAFIDEFEDRQLEKQKLEKKPNKKIKELEDKIKEKEQ